MQTKGGTRTRQLLPLGLYWWDVLWWDPADRGKGNMGQVMSCPCPKLGCPRVHQQGHQYERQEHPLRLVIWVTLAGTHTGGTGVTQLVLGHLLAQPAADPWLVGHCWSPDRVMEH